MANNGDFILKLERARSHLKDFDTATVNWGRGGHHDVINEPDPERGSDWWRVRVEADPIPLEPFATLIGDILHNLRGTLDHLAYALAVSFAEKQSIPLDQKIAKASEFPIFGDNNAEGIGGFGENMFESNGRRGIKGLEPTAQTFIKSLQPYNRGNDFASHPLWMLHELSNIDKHRFSLVSNVRSVAAGFKPDLTSNWRPTDVEVYTPIVGGSDTIAARYRATPRDPEKDVRVEFDPFMQIVFGNGTSVQGKGVIRTLSNIADFIADDIIPPLSKFL